MMSAMVDSRQLTAEDIAELSAILEKAGGGES
jgi:predicted transcriptional regulator